VIAKWNPGSKVRFAVENGAMAYVVGYCGNGFYEVEVVTGKNKNKHLITHEDDLFDGWVENNRYPLPVTVEKPWGKEIWFAGVDGKYMGKILVIQPGQRSSFHQHEFKEETMIVFAGVLEVLVEDGGQKLKKIVEEGGTVHFLPGEAHSLGAGDSGCILFEVSTDFPDDSIRIEDFYGRKVEDPEEILEEG
jgi:quercetin dioxygenase-like cupin family protein